MAKLKFTLVIPVYHPPLNFISHLREICYNNSEYIYSISFINTVENEDDELTNLVSNSFINFRCFIININKENFNHGGSRNIILNYADVGDIVIYMTQDALITNNFSWKCLGDYFDDLSVGAVCCRQLPHSDANPIAIHLRLFNYPQKSRVLSKLDISRWGLKTAFISNSFSAYRVSLFRQLGGFPDDVILAEDMFLAAKIILAGYRIGYSAETCVKHSHNYTPWQEFKRYFDIGVFHSTESWIQEKFGGAGGEGKRFLISEFKYLLKNAPMWIPRACITNFCKILGYKLGKNYKKLPRALCPKLSMHKAYWSQKKR